jgi:phage shock protein E
MITLLKKLFGKTSSPDFSTLIAEGALILDVRTRNEYAGGHLKNSMNIPLNELPAQLKKLKKEKTIITCCASGMRSSSAKNILQSNGFIAYNGGSWMRLKKFENEQR